MSDLVVCLACGGAVDPPGGVNPGMRACHCPAPSEEAKSILCPGCGGSMAVGARACPYCGSTVATCRCAACLAWNLAGAAHCQACGRSLASLTESAGVAASYPCPRCGSHLHAREYGNLSVEECDKCGGLLLAPATMDRLVAARDLPTSLRLAFPKREMKRETAVRYIACPTCGKSMNRQAFGRISGVVVDVCKHHGVWFDAGELVEVIHFVEQGGLERERERALTELAERERHVREVEMKADRMDSPGISFLAGNVNSDRIGHPHSAAEVLHFIADLWR
jgi:Zn-finger nucleic acid-binding protein